MTVLFWGLSGEIRKWSQIQTGMGMDKTTITDQKVSEYDQEIPLSYTADQPTTP